MRVRPEVTGGPVGNDELNLCLVSVPHKMPALRSWVEVRFRISPKHSWRTITADAHRSLLPVNRSTSSAMQREWWSRSPARDYYALASGELAADAIISQHDGRNEAEVAADYSAAHAKLYRGRLSINFARARLRCYLRVSPRRFWKWCDSNPRCFDS